MGEAYSSQISQLEVFDGKGHKRVSKGAKASRNVKNGHSNKCKQRTSVRLNGMCGYVRSSRQVQVKTVVYQFSQVKTVV